MTFGIGYLEGIQTESAAETQRANRRKIQTDIEEIEANRGKAKGVDELTAQSFQAGFDAQKEADGIKTNMSKNAIRDFQATGNVSPVDSARRVDSLLNDGLTGGRRASFRAFDFNNQDDLGELFAPPDDKDYTTSEYERFLGNFRFDDITEKQKEAISKRFIVSTDELTGHVKLIDTQMAASGIGMGVEDPSIFRNYRERDNELAKLERSMHLNFANAQALLPKAAAGKEETAADKMLKTSQTIKFLSDSGASSDVILWSLNQGGTNVPIDLAKSLAKSTPIEDAEKAKLDAERSELLASASKMNAKVLTDLADSNVPLDTLNEFIEKNYGRALPAEQLAELGRIRNITDYQVKAAEVARLWSQARLNTAQEGVVKPTADANNSLTDAQTAQARLETKYYTSETIARINGINAKAGLTQVQKDSQSIRLAHLAEELELANSQAAIDLRLDEKTFSAKVNAAYIENIKLSTDLRKANVEADVAQELLKEHTQAKIDALKRGDTPAFEKVVTAANLIEQSVAKTAGYTNINEMRDQFTGANVSQENSAKIDNLGRQYGLVTGNNFNTKQRDRINSYHVIQSAGESALGLTENEAGYFNNIADGITTRFKEAGQEQAFTRASIDTIVLEGAQEVFGKSSRKFMIEKLDETFKAGEKYDLSATFAGILGAFKYARDKSLADRNTLMSVNPVESIAVINPRIYGLENLMIQLGVVADNNIDGGFEMPVIQYHLANNLEGF